MADTSDGPRTVSGTATTAGGHPVKLDVTVSGSELTPDQIPDIQSSIVDLVRYMIDPSAPKTEALSIHGEFSKTEHNKGGIGT